MFHIAKISEKENCVINMCSHLKTAYKILLNQLFNKIDSTKQISYLKMESNRGVIVELHFDKEGNIPVYKTRIKTISNYLNACFKEAREPKIYTIIRYFTDNNRKIKFFQMNEDKYYILEHKVPETL